MIKKLMYLLYEEEPRDLDLFSLEQRTCGMGRMVVVVSMVINTWSM